MFLSGNWSEYTRGTSSLSWLQMFYMTGEFAGSGKQSLLFFSKIFFSSLLKGGSALLASQRAEARYPVKLVDVCVLEKKK